MLSYRHQFHAGNFADVFKHALLLQLVRLLCRKDRPLLYLETHAGTGRYDLRHPWALKHREYQQGIARVWRRDDAPASLHDYLHAIRGDNAGGRLHWYPGSPLLAGRCLRASDRMVLAELNREDGERLARLFRGDSRVQVRYTDGYQLIRSCLPPPERRGLILIDSSFDRAGEFRRITDAVTEGCRRFATGVFAVWYPLMQSSAMRRFERDFAATGPAVIAKAELSVHPPAWRNGMRGCGLLVTNPPYGFVDQARSALEWLWSALAPDGAGGWSLDMLRVQAQSRTTKLTIRPGT